MNIFLSPEEVAELTWQYPSLGEIALFIISVAFFLFLNAFFVANEFASARVRQSQLLPTEKDSLRNSRQRARALHIVQHLDSYLSANQVGITLASLALGGIGHPFIEKLIAPPLSYFCHLNGHTVSIISYACAFSLFTFAHVVLGELVPKSLAIRHPLEVSMGTSTWMMRFAKSTSLIIRLFNGTANWIGHKLFGIDPHYDHHASPHSAEELAHLVEESERTNELTEMEAEISMNALELNDRSVHDILVPRSEIDVLNINDPFEKNLDIAANSRHTRFPLVDGHLDNVKGWIHAKDMLRLVRMDKPDLMLLRRELKIVPESMKLDNLLNFFSAQHTHFALVVDEYGEPSGLVYLDDVLEELMGDDIHDEIDGTVIKEFFPVAPGEYIANGGIALFDLEEELPELGELAANGISTLGGYITSLLGHLPSCNEQLLIKNYLATVTGTDGRRVTQVRLVRQDAPQAT